MARSAPANPAPLGFVTRDAAARDRLEEERRLDSIRAGILRLANCVRDARALGFGHDWSVGDGPDGRPALTLVLTDQPTADRLASNIWGAD